MAHVVTSPAALRLLAAAAAAALAAQAAAQPVPSRGRLLYDTHCVACHNEQVHWRDKGEVTSWPTLVEQVRRWQARGGLAWDEADIREVSRFLNDTVYRLPVPASRG